MCIRDSSREAQGTITTNAGPEIGVASTKAFTAQLTALFLLALRLGQVRGAISDAESLHLVNELSKIPHKLANMLALPPSDGIGTSEGAAAPAANIVILSGGRAATGVEGPASWSGSDRRTTPRLSLDDHCCEIAKLFSTARDFLYLGRGIHYPIALEGALKLKEISYIHAEGYPARCV